MADDAPQALPDIDFATFVLSLGSSALVHLGEEVDEGSVPMKNLPLAKQTIDILAMIETKTRGNLEDGETKLLSALLYDLRIKYVDACKT